MQEVLQALRDLLDVTVDLAPDRVDDNEQFTEIVDRAEELLKEHDA